MRNASAVYGISGGGGIKSVQRGVASFSSVDTVTVMISAVDTTKAFVNPLGDYASSSTQPGARFRYELTNATTLTITRGSAAGTASASWEVVENN